VPFCYLLLAGFDREKDHIVSGKLGVNLGSAPPPIFPSGLPFSQNIFASDFLFCVQILQAESGEKKRNFLQDRNT
jgi:hypothetical protein